MALGVGMLQEDGQSDITGSFTSTVNSYRVSTKSFPDYIHLLQENYVDYKPIFCNVTINT
jgi:hypothetical protein